MTKNQIFGVLCREAWYAYEKSESIIGALNAYSRQLKIIPSPELYLSVMGYVQDRKMTLYRLGKLK
jgi:hypothetical protein